MDFPATDTFFSLFQGESRVLQFIGKWGYIVYEERDLIQQSIHMILSALFVIYIGSHASLRRPPSAAAPLESKAEEDDDLEFVEVEETIEGLSPLDAIIMPITAGLGLGGLYFLIKWLRDPKLLNRILGWYCSIVGVFGVGKMIGDGLHVATTFLFPCVWSDYRHQTFYIEPLLSQQVEAFRSTKSAPNKTTPFPGFLSEARLPPLVVRVLWSFRSTLKGHWIFRCYIHGICNTKSKVQLNDIFGFIVGVAIIILYNASGTTWWLTNIMGFGFVYAGLQLMSPTTFWTGTLVLTAMFIYDVVMVFYTPMMITVAKSLDVPIKILLPGATRTSMLGLGDIILPGIIMALALRFDLYLHYLRKQRTSLSLPKTPGGRAQQVFIGAPYVDATGKWGERFWTRRGNKSEVTAGDAARFSKIYFKASIVGYIIALILTVVIMAIFNHGQPALLYLVPAVLIALWGTALVRGEALLMWGYTEDGSIDVEARLTPPLKKVKEGSDDSTSSGDTDHSGNTDSSGGGAALRAVDSDNTSITEGEKSEAEAKKGKGKGKEKEKEREKDEHAHHVFLFSLSEPRRPCAKKTSVFEFKGAD